MISFERSGNVVSVLSNGIKRLSIQVDTVPIPNPAPVSKGWGDICNGCGECCYYRFLLEGKIHNSGIPCKHLDTKTNQCRVYDDREITVEGCAKMSPRKYPFGLPASCSYRDKLFPYKQK